MGQWLLLPLSVVGFALNGVCTKWFQQRLQRAPSSLLLYQGLFCLAAALCFGISSLPAFALDLYTLGMGMLYGLLYVMAVWGLARGYQLGSLSLTDMLVNLSFVIPILYSVLFLHEGVRLTQAVGLVFLLAAFVLSYQSGEKGNGRTVHWAILVFLAFLANGITAVIQKLYKREMPAAADGPFMGIAYLTAAALFLLLFWRRRSAEEPRDRLTANPWGMTALAVVAGAGGFVGNGLLMRLSTQIDAVVLYPCVNGGLSLLLAAVSFLFFREKLTPRKGTAIAAGLVAIVLLNL